MSDMEPEVRSFLVKIASSLSAVILWLLINTTVGIGLNYAFFEERPRMANYIFYIWFVISLIWIIFYLRRKWK